MASADVKHSIRLGVKLRTFLYNALHYFLLQLCRRTQPSTPILSVSIENGPYPFSVVNNNKPASIYLSVQAFHVVICKRTFLVLLCLGTLSLARQTDLSSIPNANSPIRSRSSCNGGASYFVLGDLNIMGGLGLHVSCLLCSYLYCLLVQSWRYASV